MDGFLIQQGRFTSTGSPVILALPAGVDYITVDNLSTIGTAANPAVGYNFSWQSGMANGDAVEILNTAGATAMNERLLSGVPLTSGFSLVNQGIDPVLGTPSAATVVTNATNFVITVAATSIFGPIGSQVIIMISQTAANVAGANGIPGLLGIPFLMNVTDATHLTFADNLQQAQGVAGAAETLRQVNIDSSFYPSSRFIVNITTANPLAPIITTSTAHGYLAGQKVQFFVPDALNGMTQISGQVGTITAVTATTFTVTGFDTTGFTAFLFPTAAALVAVGFAYTPAQVAPYGEDTAFAIGNNLNVLSDSRHNVLLTGIKLGAGIHGPAGVNGNIIQWRTWKAYNLFNTGQNVNQNPNP